MRIKDIELENISRYRGELMGIAMLFIILFHVSLPRNDLFFGLRRMGNIGVDMFLFLSGIGLWFSWIKTPSARHFFMKRYLRVYPAWLIVACFYYIPRFHGGDLMAWIDLIGDITINWDFWLHDELTFWYIPATMLLYCFAPAYMELIRRHPIYRWLVVVMILWCVLVQYVTPIHQVVGHIEIFWSRVPIFFIGIFLEQSRHGLFPLYIERMLYIPLTLTTILLLNRVLRRTPRWFNKAFKFVGALSLECYLIHIHFVLDHLPKPWGYWLTFFVCLLITLPAAYLLSKIVNLISKSIEKAL